MVDHFNVENGHLICYYKEENTMAKIDLGNVIGPKGAKGDTGAIGPKGDKGDIGATGPKGDKGDKGATGATGATGPKGDKGATGATGPKGAKGDPGISPRFTIESDGHLYADYDNPYTPS